MSESFVLARTRPCTKCTPEKFCGQRPGFVFGCAIWVPIEILWEFRQDFPEAELIHAEPKERVIWEYWKADYGRSYHGEPSIVELGEIQ